MRFYECEAKRLLAKHGIPVPKSALARTAAEAERLATDIGCPVIVKAQVLSPAALKTGATQSADSPAAAKQAAERLLQLDDGGRKPHGVLVERRPRATHEYALGLTYDGSAKKPVIIASDMAGNVDEIAHTHPERVKRRHFSALFPFSDYLAKELAAALGLKGQDLTRMTSIVSRLAQLFLKYDLTQVDITSLA